jgi:hypothetical protein
MIEVKLFIVAIEIEHNDKINENMALEDLMRGCTKPDDEKPIQHLRRHHHFHHFWLDHCWHSLEEDKMAILCYCSRGHFGQCEIGKLLECVH